jgi:hypothetical protein
MVTRKKAGPAKKAGRPRKAPDQRHETHRRYPGEDGYRRPSGTRGLAGRSDRGVRRAGGAWSGPVRTEADYLAHRDEILARVGGPRRWHYGLENAVLEWEADPAERERARESRSEILERQCALFVKIGYGP